MAQCYKGITVDEVQAIVNAVKISVDDMTPDELRIYKKIRPLIEKQGEQWAEDIFNDRATNPSLRDVIAPVLTEELTTTMQRRTAKISQTLGTPPLENDNTIIDWLSNHVPMVTRGIDQTSADVIQKVVGEFRTTPGMTIQDVQSRLSYAYDPNRAKMIAITETTRAASQATTSYQDYLRERGINMIRVWNTNADELVCPICAPLNGKTEKEWGAEFPDGAPAHVNCRCDTSLRLDREAKPTEDAPQTTEEQFLAPESVTVGAQPAPTAPSVDDIYNSVRDSLPPEAMQAHDELKASSADMVRLTAEIKKMPDGPEKDALQTELQEVHRLRSDANRRMMAYDNDAAMTLIRSLQNETPQQVVIRFVGRVFTKAEQARISEAVRLTAGIAPDSGAPMVVNIQQLRGNNTGAAWNGKGDNGTVYIPANGAPETHIIHETLHGLQANYQYGIAATDAFVAQRIAGEPLVTMAKAAPGDYMGVPKNIVTYKDAVEDVQTLRSYAGTRHIIRTDFPEVLTMPISSLTRATNGIDPEPLKLFLQIVKDGGK